MKNLRVVYGNTELELEAGFTLTKSSQDITYSDLTCNFNNKTKSDLPEKYQELKIVDKDTNTVIAYGYIDEYTFGEMREKDIDKDINISLLTPKKITTLRTAIAVGTYQLKNLIENKILVSLIDDGFNIKEFNITDREVSVNYLAQTIEYCLNDLSNKFSFWWYIDENKNIYIKDISLLLNGNVNHTYDDNNLIAGLEYVKPITSSGDYANLVNFTNVRIYEYSRYRSNEQHNVLIDNLPTNWKNGETIDFNFPVDIKKENIVKSAISNGTHKMDYTEQSYGLNIWGTTSNGSFNLYIKVNSDGIYEQSSNVGFEGNNDDQDKEFLLIKDSFFSNLITGIKYNGSSTVTSITQIDSDSALIWNVNKFYNDRGIEDKKGIISKTGIVEITVDMNETWKTIQELTEIGRSYIEKNSIDYADEVELKLDKDIINIGEIIYINKFFIDDNYIVTEIQRVNSNNDDEFVVTCKKANMLSNFIDLFRGEASEVSTDKTFQVYVTHYEEESIKESYEVV